MNDAIKKPTCIPVSNCLLRLSETGGRKLSAAHRQSGMTMISTMIIGVFLLFQIVIAMNVIPVYLTDSSVKSIMEELPNDAKARTAKKADLKVLISKRLSMNNIYTVNSDMINIKKGRGETIVTIDYEPRGKLIGNLEYIVNFQHEARIPSK